MLPFSIGDASSACDVRLGCGWTCAIEAPDIAALEDTLDALLELPGSDICAQHGGLIGSARVLENIVLPAVYHDRRVDLYTAQERVQSAFGACGVDVEEARRLCDLRPGELTAFEKRLAGFVRVLVMGSGVIVYSRFFEGLSRDGMARAAALNDVFLGLNPAGTAIYLNLCDMPSIALDCDRHIEIGRRDAA